MQFCPKPDITQIQTYKKQIMEKIITKIEILSQGYVLHFEEGEPRFLRFKELDDYNAPRPGDLFEYVEDEKKKDYLSKSLQSKKLKELDLPYFENIEEEKLFCQLPKLLRYWVDMIKSQNKVLFSSIRSYSLTLDAGFTTKAADAGWRIFQKYPTLEMLPEFFALPDKKKHQMIDIGSVERFWYPEDIAKALIADRDIIQNPRYSDLEKSQVMKLEHGLKSFPAYKSVYTDVNLYVCRLG